MTAFISWLLGRQAIDQDSDAAGDRLAFKALVCAETAAAVRMEIDLLMSAPAAIYRF